MEIILHCSFIIDMRMRNERKQAAFYNKACWLINKTVWYDILFLSLRLIKMSKTNEKVRYIEEGKSR